MKTKKLIRLEENIKEIDKIENIIISGGFSFYPRELKEHEIGIVKLALKAEIERRISYHKAFRSIINS